MLNLQVSMPSVNERYVLHKNVVESSCIASLKTSIAAGLRFAKLMCSRTRNLKDKSLSFYLLEDSILVILSAHNKMNVHIGQCDIIYYMLNLSHIQTIRQLVVTKHARQT